MSKQHQSDLLRDITDPGWREVEAKRQELIKSLIEEIPVRDQTPFGRIQQPAQPETQEGEK